MSFLSIEFILLISILLILTHFIRRDSISSVLLLIAGYVFYASFDLPSLILLILLSFLTFTGGRIIDAKRKNGLNRQAKILCILFVSVQTLILCFFKYSGLFPMPVGLSFYMLQTISFLVDCYRGDIGEFPSLIDTLVYISFFPVIVSGPIQKARNFIPKLSTRSPLTGERFSRGIQLFVLGAFLKLVMADRLAVSVDSVYSSPLVYSGLTLFITSIGYTLQLLFDFAGYSDMAIGFACLLGFDLAPNFNLPYLSAGPTEFWRRWHISLSSWLRDYVYIPLGGNRKGRVRTLINTFLTMIISGLWHGSTFNYLIWGALHGLWQVIYRLTHDKPVSGAFDKKPEQKNPLLLRISHCASMIISFLIVSFLWIPFRVSTLNDAWIVFSRIITLKPGAGYYYVYTFIFGIILLIVQIIAGRYTGRNNPFKPLPLDRFYGKFILCCAVIAIAMFAYFGNGAFIYSQF